MFTVTVTDPLGSSVLSSWVGTDTVAVPDVPIDTCLVPRFAAVT